MHDDDDHDSAAASANPSNSPLFFPTGKPAQDLDAQAAARLSAARKLRQWRRKRLEVFNKGLFGEPAWDTLLCLYLADGAGRRLTRADLTRALKLPASAAVRWQNYLERLGLIELAAGTAGSLDVVVRLSAHGRRAMDDYLTAIMSVSEASTGSAPRS